MSLINDVLKQVDRKPSGRSPLLAVTSLPTSINESASRVPKLIFLCICALLMTVIIFQTLSGESITRLFDSGSATKSDVNDRRMNSSETRIKEAKVTEDKITEIVILPRPVTSANKHQEFINNSNSGNDENIEDHQDIDRHKEKVEIKAIKNKAAIIKAEAHLLVPNSIATSREKNQSVSVIKVEQDKANYYYRKSLLNLNAGKLSQSEALINSAIAIRGDVQYVVLKARLLIELKNSDKFYNHVARYSDLRDSRWLKIAAPGLQIFSFSQLSNQYYYLLIELEPRNIQWKLAMALNFLRLNKIEKSLAIYQALTKSEGISRQRMNWLNKKIHQLKNVED